METLTNANFRDPNIWHIFVLCYCSLLRPSFPKLANNPPLRYCPELLAELHIVVRERRRLSRSSLPFGTAENDGNTAEFCMYYCDSLYSCFCIGTSKYVHFNKVTRIGEVSDNRFQIINLRRDRCSIDSVSASCPGPAKPPADSVEYPCSYHPVTE